MSTITQEQIAAALEDSIAHWKRMREMPLEVRCDSKTRERPNAISCPLCLLINPDEDGCVGCPVYERTKRDWCFCTPYHVAQMSFKRPDHLWHPAADAEIAFLESLRVFDQPGTENGELRTTDEGGEP